MTRTITRMLLLLSLLSVPLTLTIHAEGKPASGWGTATLIENDNTGGAISPEIAMNSLGNAFVVWQQSDGSRDNIWANRYTVGSGWETPTRLENDNLGNANYPKIDVDSSGNAVAVWYQSDGLRNNIWANRYTVGSGWGNAVLIETDNAGNAYYPDVAVDSSGNAIAVWSQFDGSRNNIWANRYTVGSGWGTATLIENDNTGGANYPTVGVDPSGNAVAIWSQYDGSQYNILANRFTVGSGWGTAVLIENDNAGSAHYPNVAVDSSGNAVAVWYQFDGTRYNIWANRYTIGSGWGTATLIENDNAGSALYPKVAVDSSGNAVAVWYQNDGSRDNIWANRYTVGSGWGTATLIENDNSGSAHYPNVAVDSSGNAVAVWYQFDGTRYNIWANRYTIGSGWGNAGLIENDNVRNAEGPKVAIDISGNAIAVWHQDDGSRYNIWANRYTISSGWGTATLIETDNSGDAVYPNVALDSSGNAVAVWQQYDGLRYSIWGNRYNAPDTTPPHLDINSPSDGEVVQTSAVTVSGTTEPDAKLNINGIFVYIEEDGSFSVDIPLRKGANTLIITSTDGSGNKAHETRTVTFKDPIDSHISSILSSIAELEETVSELEYDLSIIENSLASLTNDVNSKADSISNNISLLKDELNLLQIALGSAKENITSLKDRLELIEGKENVTVNLTGVHTMLETLENKVEGYDSDIRTLQTKLASHEAEIKSLETDISSHDAEIESLKTKGPEKDKDIRDDLNSLRTMVIFLGAVLLLSIFTALILFIILLAMVARRRTPRIEE